MRGVVRDFLAKSKHLLKKRTLTSKAKSVFLGPTDAIHTRLTGSMSRQAKYILV